MSFCVYYIYIYNMYIMCACACAPSRHRRRPFHRSNQRRDRRVNNKQRCACITFRLKTHANSARRPGKVSMATRRRRSNLSVASAAAAAAACTLYTRSCIGDGVYRPLRRIRDGMGDARAGERCLPIITAR